MPFGLSNAPSTFQMLMDNVLRGLQWEKCLVYLDDIVFSKTFSETLDNLRYVMQRLEGLPGIVVNQVVAPKQIRRRILESLHDSPTGAHLGRSKTVNRVRYRFYCSGYKQDIISLCPQWNICARSKSGPKENEVN